MVVKEQKRPIWGIDKYIHFVVLGLSILNILQLIPKMIGSGIINNSLSVLLSLIGLIAFWLIHKKKNGGELLILIWSIPQILIFVNYPQYTIDLSQGFSLPFGMTFESSTNEFTQREVSLSVNIVAGILIGASFFRLKNKSFYKEINIHPIDIKGLNDFKTTLEKSFSFGKDKKMMILNSTSGTKSYALQLATSDNLRFEDKDLEYLLCEIDTNKTQEESFKPYEFKQLGNVKITNA